MEVAKKSNAFLFALVALLALRFPLLYLGAANIVPEEISLIIYLCGTYFLSGLLIYQNRKNLMQYNITPIALILFLVAPLLAILAGNDYDPTLWARIGIAIVFAILLFTKGKYRFHFGKANIRNIFFNIFLTVLLCAVMPIVIHAIRGFPFIENAETFDIPYIWLYQLSSAAISEEPLFRGFLWGFLKSKGIKDLWICLIQAGLFWIGHIYYIGTGINFWVVHPLCALILGLIVWKTKSITHSMVVHSSMNTFADYLRTIPF